MLTNLDTVNAQDTTSAEEALARLRKHRRGTPDPTPTPPLAPTTLQRCYAPVRRALDYRRLLQQNAMYRQDLEEMVSARTGMLHQAIADLERSYDITLEALGDALDLKDAETEGHSKRVTAFTIALARGAGIPAHQIPIVARGAFLHDIGKIHELTYSRGFSYTTRGQLLGHMVIKLEMVRDTCTE